MNAEIKGLVERLKAAEPQDASYAWADAVGLMKEAARVIEYLLAQRDRAAAP